MKAVKLKIRKGDTVEVITGGDKGKRGSVLEIDPAKLRIKVQGVKMMTHFDREEGQHQKEAFISYSNVKFVEAAKKKKKAAAKSKAKAK